MTRMKVLLALLFAIVAPTSSSAATLFTPPLSFQVFFGTSVKCKITNVAASPTVVRVGHVSQRGRVFPDSGEVRLEPAQTFELDANGAGRTYCRFDVDGSARRVRASACGVDSGTAGCNNVLPAE